MSVYLVVSQHTCKMLRLIAALCLVTATLGNPLTKDVPRLDGRIIGGYPANIADFPWQLVFRMNGQFMCGACIIGADWALTAAHCTDGSSASSLTLKAGSSFMSTGGDVYQVAEIFQHALYDPDTIDYDFSLLRVATPFEFKLGVAAIALPDQDEPVPDGVSTLVSGWGVTGNGHISEQLQAVALPTFNQVLCNGFYENTITDRMLCTYTTYHDSCQGDSGGPMVYQDKLIGVVSWGIGCAELNHPGVYGRVASVRDWIAETSGV